MSLDLSLSHQIGAFSLEAQFEGPRGVTALFGHSGAGKSLIAKSVAGLIRPKRARIVLDDIVFQDTAAGVFIPPHQRRVGIVFQDARLFPHLSVAQNLDYGRRAQGLVQDAAEARRITELLGIDAFLSRRPGGLSGGERQRVALARALLSRPRLLVLDEPMAALDSQRKAEILSDLERIRDQTGIPILLVSHAMEEVARLTTTLVLLREGRVIAAGPLNTILSDPAQAGMLDPGDSGAVLSATVGAQVGDGLTLALVSGGAVLIPNLVAAPGARVRLRIKASDVILSLTPPEGLSALNCLPASVVQLRIEGARALVQLRIGSDEVLAALTARSARALGLQPGTACHAILKTVAVAQSPLPPAESSANA